jgi:hypothetical protein
MKNIAFVRKSSDLMTRKLIIITFVTHLGVNYLFIIEKYCSGDDEIGHVFKIILTTMGTMSS